MIHPSHVTGDIAPPILAKRGFRSNGWKGIPKGHWAASYGMLRPFIVADPLARFQNGYRGLVAHEALHCLERHVFWSTLVKTTTFGLFTILLLHGLTWGGAQGWIVVCASFGVLLGGMAYLAWWSREREIRADAFALEEVGLTGFYTFLLMVGHPAVADGPAAGPLGFAKRLGARTFRRWLRWVYARTINERVARAARRRSRLGWPLPLPRPPESSPSASSEATAAPQSKSPAPASPTR